MFIRIIEPSLMNMSLSENHKLKRNERISNAKRGKYIVNSVQLEFPPCNVCGRKATGIHYGVNTCEACKIFFRRCQLHKKPYVCYNGGGCKINESVKGPVCSACRAQKCKDEGMSMSGIRKGRYTLTERNNTIRDMKILKERSQTEWRQSDSESPKSSPSDTTSTDLSPLFGCDIYPFVPGLSDQTEGSFDNSFTKLTTDVSSHPKAYSQETFKGGSLENKSVSNSSPDLALFSLSKIQTVLSSTDLKTPADYINEDINKLERSSIIESIVNGFNLMKYSTVSKSKEEVQQRLQDGYILFEEKKKVFGKLEYVPNEVFEEVYQQTKIDVDGRLQRMRSELYYEECLTWDIVAFTRWIPTFSTLSMNDQISLMNAAMPDYLLLLDYACVDPVTNMLLEYDGSTTHVSELHPYLAKEVYMDYINTSIEIQRLDISREVHAVALAVYLTFTDRCTLENPTLVDKIQTALIQILEYLVEGHIERDGRKKFYKIMDLFIKLRKVGYDEVKAFKKMAENSLLTDNIPEYFDCLNINDD